MYLRRRIRGNEEARNNNAVLLLQSNNKDETTKENRRAVQIKPSLAIAQENIAKLALGANKGDNEPLNE
jgi:hypothetical protein